MTGAQLITFKVSLLSTLTVVLVYVLGSQFTLLRNLEAKALNLRFQVRGAQHPESPVILVGIDDRSIDQLGRWPWSRSRFAEIVQRLHAAGAKAVAFDLLLTESETTIDQALLGRLRPALEAFDRLLPTDERQALEHILRQMDESSGPDAALASAMRAAMGRRYPNLSRSFGRGTWRCPESAIHPALRDIHDPWPPPDWDGVYIMPTK
jgi:CHASE2 domain-containing sensor protein